MTSITINLPPIPARECPTLTAHDASSVRALLGHVRAPRFEAEYVHETEGTGALFGFYAAVVQDNLNAWLLSGDYPSRPCTAEEYEAWESGENLDEYFPIPKVPSETATSLRTLIVDTAAYLASAEEHERADTGGVLRVLLQTARKNFDAWIEIGDYPARPRPAAEVLTGMAGRNDLDVETVVAALLGGRA